MVMVMVSMVAIFLMIFLLIIVPYLGVMQLRVHLKKQRLDDRLLNISKRSRLKNPAQGPSVRKSTLQQQHTKMILGRVLFFTFLPIPPLVIIFFSGSFSSSFMKIVIYFAIIGGLTVLVKSIRERRRKKAFITDLPNVIDLIIRSLRAGRTIIDSIRTASEEIHGPVADQFKNIVDQVDVGKDFINIVKDVSRRLNIAEFSFFVIVLSVQQETGGNVIKTLSSLSNMLRQRQLMRMKIKALSAEGIFSAFLMGSLPIFLVGVIELMRPAYLNVLFTTTSGQHVLMAAVIGEVIGCLVIARLVHIDV